MDGGSCGVREEETEDNRVTGKKIDRAISRKKKTMRREEDKRIEE